MFTPATRRGFLKNTAAAAGAAALGLPAVSGREAKLDPTLVRLDSGIEPLVRLIELTPRGKLLEEIGARVKKGLGYRDVVTALFLAGVRNIRPHGGDNFHAVLVIHAAQFETVRAVRERVIGGPPYPTWTVVGARLLYGFDFEIKAVARIPPKP